MAVVCIFHIHRWGGVEMKHAAFLIVGFLFFTIAASPAEAKRFRFFAIPGFGGSGESIDLVYDLPDKPPFARDGESIDVGYLNSPRGNAYVVYHGDRYRKLSDEDLAILTAILGFDPTAAHRAKHAPQKPADSPKAETQPVIKSGRIGSGHVMMRRADESTAEFAARKEAFIKAHRSSSAQSAASPSSRESTSGGASHWGLVISVIAFIAILLSLAWKGFSSVVRFVKSWSSGTSGDDESMKAAYAALDARVAERLSKLQPEPIPQTVSRPVEQYHPAPSFAAGPAVRSFGRRNA